MKRVRGQKRCSKLIFRLSFFLLFMFLAGCAGVTIRDNLPPASPKGYADFAHFGLNYEIIYSIQNGRKVREGSLSYTGETLRLARAPGNYDFLIVHEDDRGRITSKIVTVAIKQDRLTFVTIDKRIRTIEYFQSGDSEGSLTTYDLVVSLAGNPAPLSLEAEKNADSWLTLLDDPDWRTRLYAVGFFAEKGIPADDRATRKLKTLATDDPTAVVRKTARTFLKSLGMDVYRDLLLLDNFESNKTRWINPRGGFDSFYNDELLFHSAEGICKNQLLKSPLDLPRDFDVELTSTWRSGTSGREYGLLMGSDKDNYDHFAVSGDGRAAVRQMKYNEAVADPIGWTDVPAIPKHGSGPVRLRVEARGTAWKYFVNGAHVGSMTQSMIVENYLVGLRVCGDQSIAFEQLKISPVRADPAGPDTLR